MKKLVALVAVAGLFLSCSDDDTKPTPEEKPFFNLHEGNLWVYKRFIQNHDGVFVPSGRIDSVRITSQELIDGKSYSKLQRKIYNNNVFAEMEEEFVRIDENGHLVTDSGVVKHPGTDEGLEYTYIQYVSSRPIGEVSYTLLAPQEITVEEKQYTVYPYSGYYTPYPGNNGNEGIGNVINYQAGLGIVSERTRYVHGEEFLENRLIDYKLN
jgi:hypothetical protein